MSKLKTGSAGMSAQSEKILLVDDEPIVLDSYLRLLRGHFQIVTAASGSAALRQIQEQGPFAVVVSDMRMPGMDGIEFLLKVKHSFPDTVRVMLTGAAELKIAIEAVNEGNIFRFLSKPCSKETLVKTLADGLAQHKLVCAERELLENTLRSTVQVLTDVLSLVSPAAFSRASRVRRYVQHVAARLGLPNPWKLEVAAMMSQLGCVTLDPDTIEKVYTGATLSPEEQSEYVNHPLVAESLLKNIPRLESIAWMIAHQNQPLPTSWDASNREMAEMRSGAQLLRGALAFDLLLRKGVSRVEAAHQLTRRFDSLDPKVFSAMIELEPEVAGQDTRRVRIAELPTGMILEEEVRTQAGVLVAAKGQEVTLPLLRKLQSYSRKGAIPGEVVVSPPKCAGDNGSPGKDVGE
jgi:CheY-like chemotaxis protein